METTTVSQESKWNMEELESRLERHYQSPDEYLMECYAGIFDTIMESEDDVDIHQVKERLIPISLLLSDLRDCVIR